MQDLTNEMLNLIGQATIVDLSHTFEARMPVFPTHPQFGVMPWDTHDIAAMNLLLLGEHCGTHADSPSHFLSDVAGGEGTGTIADVDLRRGLSPGILLDFSEDDVQALTSHDIASELRRSGLSLTPGTAAIFRFGWESRWKIGDATSYVNNWPGLSVDAAEYLITQGVVAVGTDCLSIDPTSAADLGAHLALLKDEVLIVENLCGLHTLPPKFLFVALPLKIAGGTGSPVRAAAVFLQET